MLKIARGNLLEAQVDALVNTVNTVGVMGKGIALQFKKAFPENFKAYKKECDAGRLQPGKMFVYQVGGITKPRYIVNFPTKKHWRGRSQIEYVRDGLKALVAEVQRLDIKSIAIPPLGCGMGGLRWNDVRRLIDDTFRELHDVHAYLYEPAGAPKPEAMPNRTERPKMTPGRAAVLALMARYLVPGYVYRLSLLEIQKLAYFLQVAGEPLRLKYQAHLYGPYADNLRHVLNRLEGHFISGFGDGRNQPNTPIELLPGAAQEAEDWLGDKPDTRERLDRVAQLMEGFETPYGMELLASTHWVASSNATARVDPDAAIEGLHDWSQRKAELAPNHIRAAWQQLREQDWL